MFVLACGSGPTDPLVRSPQVNPLVDPTAPAPVDPTQTDTSTPSTTTGDTTDTGGDDPGTGIDTATDTGTPPVASTDACYLGFDRANTTCLATQALTPVPSDYVYPAPLGGSAQYAEPSRYLVLADHSDVLELAPNFVLGEFAQEFKGPYAVVQGHAVERVQDLRDELGALIVNSGYRSPDYNAGVGGATHSRHMYGDAFDLDPVSVSLDDLADACDRHGAGFVQVYVSHIHCDWRDDPLDAAFYGGARHAVVAAARPVLDASIQASGATLTAPAVGWDEGEPLRDWTAYDADGGVLETHRGETYVPPVEAVEVEVEVGRAVTVAIPL